MKPAGALGSALFGHGLTSRVSKERDAILARDREEARVRRHVAPIEITLGREANFAYAAEQETRRLSIRLPHFKLDSRRHAGSTFQ